ncbi:MAG TPA: hypothetical protein VG222_18660 [Vicinamibacterales bacterium]|nr:hypothetical protein [Vicinamibacterales bacterium]
MTETLPLLLEFYRDKLAMMLRHQASARLMSQYDVNNTYQYIINREEVQLSWLEAAIAELGGTPVEQVGADRTVSGKKADASRHAIEEDARDAQTFVERWTPRVDVMLNARHAKMLRVILGETLEQRRFFEQALAGRTDLLGRREAQLAPSHGVVLPSRWMD